MGSDYRGNRAYACSGGKAEIFKQDSDKLEGKIKYVLVEQKASINSDVI